MFSIFFNVCSASHEQTKSVWTVFFAEHFFFLLFRVWREILKTELKTNRNNSFSSTTSEMQLMPCCGYWAFWKLLKKKKMLEPFSRKSPKTSKNAALSWISVYDYDFHSNRTPSVRFSSNAVVAVRIPKTSNVLLFSYIRSFSKYFDHRQTDRHPNPLYWPQETLNE